MIARTRPWHFGTHRASDLGAFANTGLAPRHLRHAQSTSPKPFRPLLTDLPALGLKPQQQDEEQPA